MMKEQLILSKKLEGRHRFIGIVSLVGGLSALLFLLITIGYAFYMLNIGNTDRIVFIVVNFLIFAIGLSVFVGIVFGVVGLFTKTNRKIGATIGLILSIVVGVIYVLALLWVFG